MFYLNDFKTSKSNKIFTVSDTNNFNVILSNNAVKKKPSKYSTVIAAKPLIRFASLFGSQLVRYEENDIVTLNFLNKLHSVFVIVFTIVISTVVRPLSWRYTTSDIPLNILTKTYGIINITETTYCVFCVGLLNTQYYIQLFNKLHEFDKDFGASRALFVRRRLISILMIIIIIVQVLGVLWLTKFSMGNIGALITFFLIMLQGAILYFLVLNIYAKHLLLNILLMKRSKNTLSKQKKIIIQDSVCDIIIKCICMGPRVIKYEKRFCWFELMQIYDKLGDCIYLFNKIYCGQVFIMYNSWLLCTMLIICRSLSPSIKYSERFLSDLFIYSCINSRPILLAIMCEMFTRERKKTLSLLLNVLVSPGKDVANVSQVRTMIMLVASRKIEISANVFTVNVPTVMNFAGRIISYTVLMIQYFYSRVFMQ